MKTVLHLLLGGILLPGMVLLVVPGILVWLYPIELPSPTLVRYWFSKVLLPAGFVTMGVTTAQFVIEGHGTPAPWAPPKKLITTGLYAYVRNPMILGMLLMLGGEALLIASVPIGIWCALVTLAVLAHIHLFEENGLYKRFGEDYLTYRANVPAWLPRLKAWTPTDGSDAEPVA